MDTRPDPRRSGPERRARTEATPRDACDAADVHARALYVDLADRLPGGRRRLGRYARRVALMAKGISTPTAGDWDRLAAAGNGVDAVAAYYQAEIDRLKGRPEPDVRGCIALFARESGEALAVSVEAAQDPSKLPAAIDESIDAVNAARSLACAQMRQRRNAVDLRVISLDRLRPHGPQGPGRAA